jgi:hypothetical protein
VFRRGEDTVRFKFNEIQYSEKLTGVLGCHPFGFCLQPQRGVMLAAAPTGIYHFPKPQRGDMLVAAAAAATGTHHFPKPQRGDMLVAAAAAATGTHHFPKPRRGDMFNPQTGSESWE